MSDVITVELVEDSMSAVLLEIRDGIDLLEEPPWIVPDEIPGTLLWADGADTGTIISTVDGLGAKRVSQWSDKSGLGNHLVQATGSFQPVSELETCNGLNVLSFAPEADGGSSWLTLLHHFNSNSLSIFAVASRKATAHGRYTASRVVSLVADGYADWNVWVTWSPIQYTNQLNLGHQPSATTVRENVTVAAADLTYDTASVTSAILDGDVITFNHMNVETSGSTSPNIIDSWRMSVGCVDFAGSGGALSGWIAELIVVDRAVTALEAETIRAYLRNRWNAQ